MKIAPHCAFNIRWRASILIELLMIQSLLTVEIRGYILPLPVSINKANMRHNAIPQQDQHALTMKDATLYPLALVS